MSFVKRDVKDRVVQYPHRYQLVEVSTGVYDLVPVPGTITEQGTAINKAYLQPIEDGLYEAGRFHLVRTLSLNLSTPNAVAVPPTDFEGYDEFLFVLRGTVSFTSSVSGQNFAYLGFKDDNIIGTPNYIIMALDVRSGRPSIDMELNYQDIGLMNSTTLYSLTRNSNYIFYPTTSSPHFVYYVGNAAISGEGIAYLDIYRRNIIKGV